MLYVYQCLFALIEVYFRQGLVISLKIFSDFRIFFTAMPYNYSNFTQFGIKNNVERYAYAGWQIFVVICSLLGDTTILVASIKYKAFRLNKIVVVLIEHVVASDLVQAVANLLPETLPRFFSMKLIIQVWFKSNV